MKPDLEAMLEHLDIEITVYRDTNDDVGALPALYTIREMLEVLIDKR